MPDWKTTSMLLQRLRDYEDRSAWGGFMDRFRAPLRAFARKYGVVGEDADDLVQDVLLAFAESFRGGKYDRSKGRLSAWLFGIAYHHITGQFRQGGRKARRQTAKTEFWAAVPDERQASQTWDAEWEKATLAACMRQAKREMNDQSYEAFELVVVKGIPADEVAQRLGMSRNAVYVAKHRVLKRLEELAQQYDQVES